MPSIKAARYLIALSLIIFILSFTQTAFTVHDHNGNSQMSSLMVLVMGAFAILGGGLAEWAIWLANPLYILSLILFIRSNKKSRTVSIVAAAIGLSFVLWKNILISESGSEATIVSLNAGYWLWLISLALSAAGILIRFRS